MFEGLKELSGLKSKSNDDHTQTAKGTYSSGLAFGIFLGATFTVIAFWILSNLSAQISEQWVQFITILVTLLAAFFALKGVAETIRESRRAEERQRNRKLSAARAVLPLVLSTIHDVCENRLKTIIQGESLPRREPWFLGEKEISAIKECIEFADGVAQEILKEIAVAYQIADSRYQHLELGNAMFSPNDGVLTKFAKIGAIIDWIAIKSLAECLFPYSRIASAVPNRQYAVERAEIHLWAIDNDGWALTNDADFDRIVKDRGQRSRLSFASPGWLERQMSL